jgi:hypothetical protein
MYLKYWFAENTIVSKYREISIVQMEKGDRKMTIYKPLTPNLRAKIDDAVNSQIEELKTCKTNTFVMAQISGLQACKGFIHGLPDGYLIPMKKEE